MKNFLLIRDNERDFSIPLMEMRYNEFKEFEAPVEKTRGGNP